MTTETFTRRHGLVAAWAAQVRRQAKRFTDWLIRIAPDQPQEDS